MKPASWLRLLCIAFAVGCGPLAFAQSSGCGVFDAKVRFADGAEGCMKEFEFFNRPMTSGQSTKTYSSLANEYPNAYALTITADPQMCPFAHAIGFGWGSDASKVLPVCEDRLRQAVQALGKASGAQTCKCEVLVNSGRSNLTRAELLARTKLYERQSTIGNRAIQVVEAAEEQVARVALAEQVRKLAEEARRQEEARLAKKIDYPAATQTAGAGVGAGNSAGSGAASEAANRAAAASRAAAAAAAAAVASGGDTRAAQPNSAERDRMAAEAQAARQRQQELEQQLAAQALAIEAAKRRQQDQERQQAQQQRLAAEAQALEIEAAKRRQQEQVRQQAQQQRLADEVQAARQKQELVEQQLVASKRESEERLRIIQQQTQLASQSPMTTLANRKALVFGNDSYISADKLQNAREDARAIASNLITVGYQVTLLLDGDEKKMKAALRTFSSQVQGGDEVMFFFSGHGVQIGSANYLLPTDSSTVDEARVKDEAIQLQRVLDDMSEKRAKFTLAVIDACRNNPFKQPGKAVQIRGLAPTTAATGQMIVFSAGNGQIALDRLDDKDKNKNGVFTRVFLREMLKPGISIDRIIKNVRQEVAVLARSIGHEQVPAIYDQVLGDFYFKK